MAFGLDSRRAVSIARQPILDTDGRIFAHEILHRHVTDAATPGEESDPSAARLLNDAVLAIGLEALSDGLPIFVRLTRALLLGGAGTLLPPPTTVLEVSSSIVDDEVVTICRSLRAQGYNLALDDFPGASPDHPLLPLIRYANVDVRKTPTTEWPAIVSNAAARSVELIARNADTHEMADASRAAGFRLFQGHYICKPSTLVVAQLPSRRLAYMQLLSALNREHVGIDQVEDLVKHDLSLSYRVLRAVNSAAFGIQREVTSIRDALVLLGVAPVRKWASVWAMAGLSEGDASGAVSVSLVRARCCEYVGEMMAHPTDAQGFFLLGLCSLLDVILRRPMATAVESLPLPGQVRDALLGRSNTARTALDAVVHYELGEWDAAATLAEQLGLQPDVLSDIYADAIRWAHELSRFSAAA